MPPLSYLGFHLVFVLPPLLGLGVLAYHREGAWWGRRPLSGLAIILALALVYTIPWDNLLVADGVWWYGDGATRLTIWHAPLGEYLFFLFQPILTAFWLFQFPAIEDRPLEVSLGNRAIGFGAGLAVSAVGVAAVFGPSSTYYLGAILFWAGPILAIQWGFGWPYLLRIPRTVVVAIAVPTLYYWTIDWFAITTGIWTISGTHTIGLAPAGLPVEEMLFFLVTNVFVVQGLVFYMWLLDSAPLWLPDPGPSPNSASDPEPRR